MNINTEINTFKKFIKNMDIPKLNPPHHFDEEWRFTKLNFLNDISSKITIQPNIFNQKLIDDHSSIEGLDILNMNDAINQYPSIMKQYFSNIYKHEDNYFCTENLNFITDGIVIIVKNNYTISKPLEIIFSNIIESKIFPRIFIYCSKNSKLTFIEKYNSNNYNLYTNIITEIYIDENASLEYIKFQNESESYKALNDVILQLSNVGINITPENISISIVNLNKLNKHIGILTENKLKVDDLQT